MVHEERRVYFEDKLPSLVCQIFSMCKSALETHSKRVTDAEAGTIEVVKNSSRKGASDAATAVREWATLLTNLGVCRAKTMRHATVEVPKWAEAHIAQWNDDVSFCLDGAKDLKVRGEIRAK